MFCHIDNTNIQTFFKNKNFLRKKIKIIKKKVAPVTMPPKQKQ